MTLLWWGVLTAGLLGLKLASVAPEWAALYVLLLVVAAVVGLWVHDRGWREGYAQAKRDVERFQSRGRWSR